MRVVTELKDSEFNAKTRKGKAVVDFYADWCGPCRMMAPTFEKVAQEVKGVNFFKVNVDSNQGAADSAGVRSIPTIVLFKDGEEVDRVIGVMPEAAFREKIENSFK